MIPAQARPSWPACCSKSSSCRPRAPDPEQVETILRGNRDDRGRALFWLIYDGGLRCQEALAINLEDIDWTERAIRLKRKGDRTREMFFSRRPSRYLDAYLKERGAPTVGALFITARRARSPGRADLTADGQARLLSMAIVNAPLVAV